MLSGIFWAPNTLIPGMMAMQSVVNHAVDARLVELAQEVKDYAQDNAPWEDRTGDARQGLDTQVDLVGDEHSIILYHSVDYGIWLEVRWSGTYAIIMPTIEHFGPQVMSGFELEMNPG